MVNLCINKHGISRGTVVLKKKLHTIKDAGLYFQHFEIQYKKNIFGKKHSIEPFGAKIV